MMNEVMFFLKLFQELSDGFPMTLDVHYSKTVDWSVEVVKRGCADDYPKEDYNGSDAVIVLASDADIGNAFDRAYMQLLKWFMRNEPKRLPDNVALAAEFCNVDATKDEEW